MSLAKKRARKAFNDAVFARDGHKCVMCGSTESLDAHHITDRNLMPSGGYAAENGVSLCLDCHLLAEDGTIPAEALYDMIGSSHAKAFVASVRLIL